MNQIEKARAFAALHVKGDPLVLYNAWDAGSAKAVAAAGAKAIATGSWSVSSANGYRDGEETPFDVHVAVATRIVASVDLPVTVDFEGGYGADPEMVAANAARLMTAGAVGVNFEDQVVGGEGLYDIAAQAARIGAIRRAAEKIGLPFFINTRTDLFLKTDRATHGGLLNEAKERARAYARAGASGFFAPGLVDENLIAELCEVSPLPVNIMMMEGAPSPARLARLGVARVSYGPIPYARTMAALTEMARAELAV